MPGLAYAGTSFDASAGPPGADSAGPGGGVSADATTALTGLQKRIYHYVRARDDGASYLMAVPPWPAASPYIMATGQEVLSVGGFSGSVPEPTLARLQQLVRSGQLRFFLIVSGPGRSGAVGGGAQQQRIDRWVETACVNVPAKNYQGGSAGSAASGIRSLLGSAGPGTGGSITLYKCGKGS